MINQLVLKAERTGLHKLEVHMYYYQVLHNYVTLLLHTTHCSIHAMYMLHKRVLGEIIIN